MSIYSVAPIAAATRQWKYDVFLHFKGNEEIQQKFISHLSEALCRAKVLTFLDENLTRGEEISPALLQAIEDSNVALAIFTVDYASSPQCLEALVKIIECSEYKGQIVIPVFYDVRSSVVQEQTGIYAEAFAKHEKDPKNARYVHQWKAAMTKVANLSGRSVRNTRSESELVKEIVTDILIRLGRTSDGTDSMVETGSLSVKVAHTRTVEIQVPGGRRVTKYEDLPVDQLVSLFEPLQRLSEPSLQSLENSNADSSPRRASAPGLLGYVEQSKNAGQKSGTVLNNKAKIVQASASGPKLSDYTEGSQNAGSGSSSTHLNSLPTNSEFFLPGAEDRIVLYVTSSRVIKKIFEDCDVVRKILRWLEASVDERDTLDPKHRKELQSALKDKTRSLPLLFIKGEYIGGVEEIKRLKETGQLEKLIEGVSVAGNGRIDSCNGQAPKWPSWRRVDHNEESKNVIPVGSSEVTSSSEPQAPIRRPWRRVEHNEESKYVTPVGSSEVASASEPQAPNPRSWRRLAYALARNFTPFGSSAVPFSSGQSTFFLSFLSLWRFFFFFFWTFLSGRHI